MAMKAGRVGVSPQDVDARGHVTAAGLTPEQQAKLDKALVTPVSSPAERELVGVNTGNSQIMFKIGDGLEIAGTTSPFTLKASGGGVYTHVISVDSAIKCMFAITCGRSTAFDLASLKEFLASAGAISSSRTPFIGVMVANSQTTVAALFNSGDSPSFQTVGQTGSYALPDNFTDTII